MLEAARRAGVARVVNSSTGGAIYGDADAIPTAEDHPPAPMAPYGQSKHAAEGYVGLYGRLHGLSAVSLRYANVYGPRQDPHGEGGVVAIFCGKLVEGGTPVVFGDGLQTRDYVYVGDVVAANLAAAGVGLGGRVQHRDRDGDDGDRAGGRAARARRRRAFALEHAPGAPGEVIRSAVDPALAREVLGWEAQVALAEGLGARSPGPRLSGASCARPRQGTAAGRRTSGLGSPHRGETTRRGRSHARYQHLHPPDHQRIASAFLALTDDPAAEAVQRSLAKVAAAFAAALVLALAAPMTWLRPRRRSARARSATSPPRRSATPRPRSRGRRRGRRRRRADGAGRVVRPSAGSRRWPSRRRGSARSRPRPTWGLEEGDAIAPGRTVLRRLGGGRRYEVFLVWDEHRLAVLVAKVLRPDQAERPGGGCATCAARASCSAASPTRGRARLRRRRRRAVPAPRDRAPRGPDAAVAAGAPRPGRPRAAPAARAPHRLRAALPRRRGGRAPRRQARQRRDGRAAAADRLQRRARHWRQRAPARASRPAPTPTWRPEQCDRARGALGPAADVFGLGATMHHALAGERPFPRAAGAGSSADPRCASRSSRARPRRCRAARRRRWPGCSRAMLGPRTGRPPDRGRGRRARSSRWSPSCRGGSCWPPRLRARR